VATSGPGTAPSPGGDAVAVADAGAVPTDPDDSEGAFAARPRDPTSRIEVPCDLQTEDPSDGEIES